jgi:hypothetical protein
MMFHTCSRKIPWIALRLTLVAMIAYSTCAIYSVWGNPEVRFFQQISTIQQAWSRRIASEHPGPKAVVIGGSSCVFSINGQQILDEFGVPVINRGIGIGMGLKVITLHGLSDLKRGDILIAAYEPALLTRPAELTALGTQFAFSKYEPAWATQAGAGLPGQSWTSALLALRPGSYHVITLIGKLVQGRALYRYSTAEAHPSGWMRTSARIKIEGWPVHVPQLSQDARQTLLWLRRWCEGHAVEPVYSVPWAYSDVEHAEASRRLNAAMIANVSEIIPTLKESTLGIVTDASLFSDTVLHLNEAGSRLRSRELGAALARREVWTKSELERIAHGKGAQ